VLVAAAVIASCRGSTSESTPANPVAAPSDRGPANVVVAVSPQDRERAVRALAVITAESLRRGVTALAADDTRGRATPSPGLDAAAAWIAKEHDRIGLASPDGAPGHLQRFDCSGRGESSNVVGVLKGGDEALADQHVIVSAHYDHLGTREDGAWGRGADEPGDAVFNGANDDASGVAATLAIAEALASLSPRPRRTIVFIAFCGEEQGLRGSSWWVEHPLVPLAKTIAVVNLEMLGRMEAAHAKRVWVTGMPLSTMGDRLAAAARDVDVEVVDGSAAGTLEGTLFRQSDNWPFAEHGVVAHSLSTGVIDDHYHSVQDEPDTLDYAAMAPLVRAIALGVFVLAQDDAVPAWTGDPP
jgi:hypothetical protein